MRKKQQPMNEVGDNITDPALAQQYFNVKKQMNDKRTKRDQVLKQANQIDNEINILEKNLIAIEAKAASTQQKTAQQKPEQNDQAEVLDDSYIGGSVSQAHKANMATTTPTRLEENFEMSDEFYKENGRELYYNSNEKNFDYDDFDDDDFDDDDDEEYQIQQELEERIIELERELKELEREKDDVLIDMDQDLANYDESTHIPDENTRFNLTDKNSVSSLMPHDVWGSRLEIIDNQIDEIQKQLMSLNNKPEEKSYEQAVQNAYGVNESFYDDLTYTIETEISKLTDIKNYIGDIDNKEETQPIKPIGNSGIELNNNDDLEIDVDINVDDKHIDTDNLDIDVDINVDDDEYDNNIQPANFSINVDDDEYDDEYDYIENIDTEIPLNFSDEINIINQEDNNNDYDFIDTKKGFERTGIRDDDHDDEFFERTPDELLVDETLKANEKKSPYVEQILEDDEIDNEMELLNYEDEDQEVDEYLFHVKIDPESDNEIIAKFFKDHEEDEWTVRVVKGDEEPLQSMRFDTRLDKLEIIGYLANLYDEIEILDKKEYEYMLDDKEEVDLEYYGLE